MLDKPTKSRPRPNTLAGLQFAPMSRGDFVKNWNAGKLTHVWFGEASATGGFDASMDKTKIQAFLVPWAKDVHDAIIVSSPDFHKSLAKKWGLPVKLVTQRFAEMTGPADFMYFMMAGYNERSRDRGRPNVSFVIGNGKKRHYVSLSTI